MAEENTETAEVSTEETSEATVKPFDNYGRR